MTKGGRSALKTLETSQADVQRVLRFKLPNSGTDKEARVDNVQEIENASIENLSFAHGERTVDVQQVSNDSIFITSFTSFYS